jgi:hypothetical protein
MQNQRNVPGAARLYANSWDCFKKVVANEGNFLEYKGNEYQVLRDYTEDFSHNLWELLLKRR